MPVRAPGRVSAEDNGRPKAEGKSSFSTTFYRIFSAQQTDSSFLGLPHSISKDKPSSPEKEMNTHLEASFLNWPTDYVCVLQIDTNPTVSWQYFFANRIVSNISLTSQTTATICFSLRSLSQSTLLSMSLRRVSPAGRV